MKLKVTYMICFIFVAFLLISYCGAASTSIPIQKINGSIARVNTQGAVTAVKEGKAVITVKSADGKASAKCSVTVARPIPAPSEYNPPAKGDWIITGNRIINNKTLTLNGNLIIKSGGILTLKNVKLTVKVNYDSQFGILVEPGGSMYIDGSMIATVNPLQRWNAVLNEDMKGLSVSCEYKPTGISEIQSPRFNFVVKGGKFEMTNSGIRGCGYGKPYESDPRDENTGVYLKGVENAVIEGNTFSEGFSGIILESCKSASIRKNTFDAIDTTAIFLMEGSGNTAAENTFSSNQYGIQMVQTNQNTVTGNIFSGISFEAAVWLFSGSENVISRNTISAPSGATDWACIAIGAAAGLTADNNTITGNTISGGKHGITLYHSVYNRIENNTIKDSQSGIVLGYADHNDITGNKLLYMSPEDLVGGQNTVELYHSTDNIFANNSIASSWEYGVLLSGSSTGNTVRSNRIVSCRRGIGIYNLSDNNSIINNSVESSRENSIILKNSNKNTVNLNNFINNSGTPYDDGENYWIFGGKGNYWSDYQGKDLNNDSIGDSPHAVLPDGSDFKPMIRSVQIGQYVIPGRKKIPILPLMPSGIEKNEYIKSKVVWQDTTITYTKASQLIIGSGGTLTIKNSTLIMGTEAICVQSGGTLNIIDSRIISSRPATGFLLRIQKDAAFVMKNSELHGAGFAPNSGDWGGLQIASTDATIENSLITDSYYGIELAGRDPAALKDTSIFIRNNNISGCYEAIRGISGSVEGHIEDNKITNCVKQ